MRLVAVVTKEDLVALIESFTPLTIAIDERRGRTVTLGRPQTIELVPERGLRLQGDAQIQWDVAGVPIPVTVQDWQVLLVPRVAIRGDERVVALDPIVERLDLKLVPGFIDGRISSAIRDAITSKRDKLAWGFARTLSKRLHLSARIGPARQFQIAAVAAAISVSDGDLRLAVRFEPSVERDAGARSPRAPGEAGPPSSRRPRRERQAVRIR